MPSVSHMFILYVLQEIVDKDGNSKLLSFMIPSLSKPSIYHEVNNTHLVLLQLFYFVLTGSSKRSHFKMNVMTVCFILYTC